MRDFRNAIASALMTLTIWTATANPSQADTGTVHVLFSKAGVIAAVGSGKGELTFHGKKYLFEVSGASLGATLGLSVTEFVGRALNLRAPGDLAGTTPRPVLAVPSWPEQEPRGCGTRMASSLCFRAPS